MPLLSIHLRSERQEDGHYPNRIHRDRDRDERSRKNVMVSGAPSQGPYVAALVSRSSATELMQ